MLQVANLRGVNKAATGKRIERIMQLRNANITEVSEALGLTYQCVYRWINGTTFPDIDNLVALSGIFGVRVETILVLNGDENDEKMACADRALAYLCALTKRRQSA